MITISEASYTYFGTNDSALRHVSLNVPRNSICGIVGPNGAGKTTLAKLIAGWRGPGQFTGSIQVGGRNIREAGALQRSRLVAFVGDNPPLQLTGFTETVAEEIAFGLANRGVPRERMIARVRDIADRLGLRGLLDRAPQSLSSGEQQCVAIAATLIQRPRVLVLDEPTTMLDPQGTERVFETLRDIAASGVTVVMVEHRTEVLREYADTIHLLSEGQRMTSGPPREVLGSRLAAASGAGITRFTAAAWEAAIAPDMPPVSLDDAVAAFEGFLAHEPHPPVIAPADPAEPAPPPRNVPAVVLRNVHASYPRGVHALRGVTLEIPPGNQVAIVGRNGAGKSSLARVLSGALLPDIGSVSIGGRLTRETQPELLARSIGFVFQNPDDQLFARTVKDEVAFGPRQLKRTAIDTLVNDALEATGLSDKRDIHPHDLSHADRKLLTIASVLAMNTPIVVLDEPTVGLDARAIGLVARIIAELRDADRTVITITHDLDFVAENCDRIVLLGGGRVSADRTTRNMCASEILSDLYGRLPQLAQLARALQWGWCPLTPAEVGSAFGAQPA
ncbi:ABC transporter ATP-binding protein [Hoyosella subflava]|uniref:ABC transporter-like protein n=1 Tax=Hoyosella subflava (strain DSM 45089 / JCM 17490 / NBRC 109087 / DQS3-9A1) TaxID=443218 RepID=F6ENB3_HOYSD|nr:ABC transporter ATP-binding protein [Hoyosella subflava]AEF40384.1 ABC transporter-like protein [Hoyosella subflava DQS3-9A1]